MAMKLLPVLALLPLPAFAWDFSPDPVCTLSHVGEDVDLMLTYAPEIPLYTLTLRLKSGAWDTSDTFGMAFRGQRPIDIGTQRQNITGDTLSVADSGFGNVLDGLQFNDTAFAFTEGQQTRIDLADAAPAVKAFRQCPTEAPATS